MVSDIFTGFPPTFDGTRSQSHQLATSLNLRYELKKVFGKQFITYKMTFQLDLNFRTRDLKPLDGVNNSPLDALKMMVLLCCSALSAPASC